MIRLFSKKDSEICKDIVARCFDRSVILEEIAKQYIKERYMSTGYFESKSREYPLFVYEKDGKVIAIGGIEGNMIKKLYVDPDEQGKGIGREMLNHLEDVAIRTGLIEVLLDSYENCAGFYEKQGYSVVKPFYREGDGVKIPIIIMKKVLK